MAGWQPDQYLRFDDERTRPCRDLAAQVRLDKVESVIDLGCGPGNSTAVLTERWPGAGITGLDSSLEMLERARQSNPQHNWLHGDIAQWAQTNGGAYDVVFSNAALHWVKNHSRVFPQLLERVKAGGALAVQMPANKSETAQSAMRDVASSAQWRAKFSRAQIEEWHVHEVGFYYDLLINAVSHVNIWYTTYTHVLPGVESITQWYKGSSLKPFLDVLTNAEEQNRFLQDFTDTIRSAYPVQSDGRVLFAFRRLFLVAGR